MSERGIQWFVWAHMLVVALIYGLALWVGGQGASEPFPVQAREVPLRHPAATQTLGPSHTPTAVPPRHPTEALLRPMQTDALSAADLEPRWSAD